MGTLTDRAAELRKKMNLAEKNLPTYARALPGVGESVRITRELLELVEQIAARVEAGAA